MGSFNSSVDMEVERRYPSFPPSQAHEIYTRVTLSDIFFSSIDRYTLSPLSSFIGFDRYIMWEQGAILFSLSNLASLPRPILYDIIRNKHYIPPILSKTEDWDYSTLFYSKPSIYFTICCQYLFELVSELLSSYPEAFSHYLTD